MNLRYTTVALYTLTRREVLRFARIWIQTMLPPAVTTVLYFVIFGKLIGSQIGPIDGHSYIDYIIPGLILMSVITNAYANVVASFYSSKFHGNIEEMLISPMPAYIILAGFIIGGVLRGLLVGAVVFGVSLFFGHLPYPDIGLTLLMLLMTAALFSMAGLINGVYAKSFDGISIIPTFVLTPLTYLGGIFYSLEMLPDFWRGVSLLNPIFYMINVFREGALGSSDIGAGFAIGITALFLVAFTAICLYLLDRGVGIRT
ncbi:MAG: ABC transporter permease [Gammaproteobacteria bacterium]|nr:ABC transporter permease [Gammaproteobacteria bacterium]